MSPARPAALHAFEVGVKTRIGGCDQPPIESPFAAAGLVTRYQQDRAPPRIESKGDAPYATLGIETQLLHIGVLRPIERIDPRAAGSRTEPLDDAGLGQKLDPYFGGQRQKLVLEFRGQLDRPHGEDMLPKPYAVKGMKIKFPTGRAAGLR